MRVAIGCKNGEVFHTLGETKEFMVYQIENKKIVKQQLVATKGERFGNIAYFLHELNIDTIITGGMGQSMKTKLDGLHIDYFVGVEGKTEEVIQDFINETLAYDNNKISKAHHLKVLN